MNSTNSVITKPDAGQGDGPDDDTGRGSGHTDTDHISGAGDHAVDQIVKTALEGELIAFHLAEKRLLRAAG